MTLKSREQQIVERVRARLTPAEMDRLRVVWNSLCELLAAAFIADRVTGYGVQTRLSRARVAMLEAIETGRPENELWLYGMYAAGYPPGPHPHSSRKRKSRP